MLPNPLEMSLMVTSACQAGCEHCCQREWRSNNPKYHMSIPVLKKFIDVTVRSGYVFDFLVISGGEPFLWKDLIPGVKLIKDSGIAKKIAIFSNGIALKEFNPIEFEAVYNNVDAIRITDLGFNSAFCDEFKGWFEQWKKVYFIDYSDFIVLPKDPVANSLPADCGCSHFSYSTSGLNICTLAKDLFYRYPDSYMPEGFPVDLPLSHKYLDKLIPWRKFDYSICQYCISNNKVRAKLERVPNKPAGKGGTINVEDN